MPYGIMDKATEDILREVNIDPETVLASEDAGAGMDISIVFDGALDESFIVSMEADHVSIVDAIAYALFKGFPDNEVVVQANHVYIGEDFIEGSGYMDDFYERRSENFTE
jgi:hypothetical protein